jgi:hypothetical protein
MGAEWTRWSGILEEAKGAMLLMAMANVAHPIVHAIMKDMSI